MDNIRIDDVSNKYHLLPCSGYGCAGGPGAMSGGGENGQFGATAAMVAAATTAAMQDSQPFSQVSVVHNIPPP